ncbi:transposase [Streptomyces sp. ISL-14]|nr:transposase [Streptomyces sp. ISL-14]
MSQTNFHSMRKTIEEVKTNMTYRWFLGCIGLL